MTKPIDFNTLHRRRCFYDLTPHRAAVGPWRKADHHVRTQVLAGFWYPVVVLLEDKLWEAR